MVLIDLGNYSLKGLDCTPRYLNMSSRSVDFSLARLNAPNAGFGPPIRWRKTHSVRSASIGCSLAALRAG